MGKQEEWRDNTKEKINSFFLSTAGICHLVFSEMTINIRKILTGMMRT
jgi:hypothetical protein